MYWFVTGGLCIAVYTITSTATFTCPSLFNWYPDVTDCSKFYRCIWGKGQSFNCPTGTLWSQKLLTCDFQHHVKCETTSSSHPVHHSHSQDKTKHQGHADLSVDLENDFQSQQKHQGRADLSVDLENDFQSQQKHPQKVVTEKGTYKHPLHKDKQIQKSVHGDYYKPILPGDTHDLRDNSGNSQPQHENVGIDPNMLTHFGYNQPSTQVKDTDYDRRVHDITDDGHWDYFYQEGQGNEGLTDQQGPGHDADTNYSKLHSLQQFLEDFLSSQRNTFQHQPSPRYTVQQQQQHHHHHHHQQQQQPDVLAPAAAAQEPPRSSALENARKQLLNDFLVSKLLQHSQFSGYLYKPHTLINTDGTYDVLDVQFQTPDTSQSRQLEPYRNKYVTSTEPWSLTDFFRAGYGYKRIFHAK